MVVIIFIIHNFVSFLFESQNNQFDCSLKPQLGSVSFIYEI